MAAAAYDLVLFDLDGTLVETAPEITDAVNDTLRHFGWPEVDQTRVAHWIGHGTGELLVQAVAFASDVPAEQWRASERLAAIGALYDRFYAARCGTRSRLYPQAREAMAALRERGVSLALVTNKETRYTERVLAAHGLAPAFRRVICGDTLATRKPEPAGIDACLREFGVPASRALYVGDSALDAETARRAGVAVWLLPHGYNQGRDVADAQPDRVLQGFAELRAAFEPEEQQR